MQLEGRISARDMVFSLHLHCTLHLPFQHPGQTPGMPHHTVQKPPLRPRSRSCSGRGQNPVRSAHSLCLPLCCSPTVPSSLSVSPANAIPPELKALAKPWSFHHLRGALAQLPSRENGRKRGGEGKRKKSGWGGEVRNRRSSSGGVGAGGEGTSGAVCPSAAE